MPTLAAELLQRQVRLIVAGGSPASALAAKSATTTIPIVFMNAADPVAIGLVQSFNRPGGNMTGATLLSAELAPKRLGILRDLLPALTKIAVLVNPKRPGVDAQIAQVQEAARALGLALHILNASNERDFDAAFQAAIQQHDGALAIAPDAMFLDRRIQIADLAMRYKIPTMYELRKFVDAGGLISYGPSPEDMYRQGAKSDFWLFKTRGKVRGVGVDAAQGPTIDRQITCLSCGGPARPCRPVPTQIFSDRAPKTARWQFADTHTPEKPGSGPAPGMTSLPRHSGKLPLNPEQT